jgi:plastocyanin
MRKGMWSAATLAGLVSAVVVVLFGPAVRAADTKVAMKDDLTFEPSDITVPVGGTVVWHNDGGSGPHDAKADNGSFSIPMVDPGKDSQSVAFNTPGDIKYFCTVPGHKAAGMVGTIHVGAASTPTTAPSTTTTQAAGGGATTTTATGQSTTTTTAKAANGASTTTTAAAAAGGGATTTTLPQAQSATPTSAPDSAGVTSTTTAQGGEAAEGHGSSGGSHDDDKSSPIGIAFAAVSTLLLGGVSGKLLLSKP